MTSAPSRRSATFIAALCLLTACAGGHPRTAPLVSDRPDFTEGADVVGSGVVQVEGGTSVSTAGEDRNVTIGEGLVRIGAGDRAELRLGVSSVGVAKIAGEQSTRLGDASLGVKLILSEPHEEHSPFRPTIALVATTSLPTTAPEHHAPRRIVPEAKLAAGWDFNERLSLGVNVVAARPVEENERFTEYARSASVGFALTHRIGTFAEHYESIARRAESVTSRYNDIGVTFGVTPNLQLDARVGTGGRSGAYEHFFGVGIARRW